METKLYCWFNIDGETQRSPLTFIFTPTLDLGKLIDITYIKDHQQIPSKFVEYFIKNGAYFLVGDDEYVYFINRGDGINSIIPFWHSCSRRLKCQVKYLESICYCEHCERMVDEMEVDIKFGLYNT